MYLRIQKRRNAYIATTAKGFSLVELMVALSIFSIVMVISTGAVLIMIDANAKAQAIYSSTTNLSFALDRMTRELRMGYHYYCDDLKNKYNGGLPRDDDPVYVKDCSKSGKSEFIAFTRELDNHRIGYGLNRDTDTIEFREETLGGTPITDWTPITSENITVETFEIIVAGSEPFIDSSPPDNTEQAVMDIVVRGSAKSNNGLDVTTDFNIQSRIVPHRLDIQ